MTIVGVWTRHVKDTQEMIVASDSRLSGGIRWDCCPKLFPLDRGDSAICFAGATFYAYPIILQVQKMINMHDKVKSRAHDIVDLQSNIIDISNNMLGERHGFPSSGEKDPDVTFLFCGYSWKLSSFCAWEYRYSKNKKIFEKHSINSFKKGSGKWPFVFTGDKDIECPTDDTNRGETRKTTSIGKIASNKLNIVLNGTRNKGMPYRINMEPIDTITSFIKDKNYNTIDGPIQILKIYKHLNCLPFNVYWPDSTGKTTFLGRTLLDYEKNKYLVIDPLSKRITKPNFTSHDLEDVSE